VRVIIILSFLLSTSCSHKVQIRDQNNKPVENAKVIAQAIEFSSSPEYSDSNGHVYLNFDGEPQLILVSKKGYVNSKVYIKKDVIPKLITINVKRSP
jgi:hypothetical protein